mmetsp:Transcript_2039/g.4610  ORF Transcript_2039/g.4610 Transcript_2039/m.4610 type:complete len:534 (+) Transcript_2039:141-1742(+)
MDELTPNADNCPRFDPNPFKKEKCKNCGRLWNEHLGVIDKSIVQGFIKAKQKVLEEKQKAEEEVRAKAKAKALAKKKQNQAVEDEWYFDGSGSNDKAGIVPEVPEADSDDDLGFRMFNRDELESAPIDARLRREVEANRKLKVVNLIDFGECDVPEDTSPFGETGGDGNFFHASSGTPDPLPEAAAPARTSMPPPQIRAGSGNVRTTSAPQLQLPTPARSSGTHPPADEEALRFEIEKLQQMLWDANEEKNIQVAIVRDEVLEKQNMVEELMRHRAEMEQSLQSLSLQSASLSEKNEELAQHRKINEQLQLQVEGLQALLADTAKQSCQPSVSSDSRGDSHEINASAELELRRELDELRAENFRLRMEAEAIANIPSSVPPQHDHSAVASALHELRVLSRQCLEVLAGPHAAGLREESIDTADVGEELRGLRDVMLLTRQAAERSDKDRRELEERLLSLEEPGRHIPRQGSHPVSSEHSLLTPREPSAAVIALEKQATQALREMRLQAEQNLEFIRKRVKAGDLKVSHKLSSN